MMCNTTLCIRHSALVHLFLNMPSFLRDFFFINRVLYLFFLYRLSIFESFIILNFCFCNANKILFDTLFFISCNSVAEAIDNKTYYNSIYSSPTHSYSLGERTIGVVDVHIQLTPSQIKTLAPSPGLSFSLDGFT